MAVVATFTALYCREGSVPFPGICVSRCAGNARSQWARLRRTIARATNYFRFHARESVIVGCAGGH